MSRIKPEEVREIAALARLALGQDEVARMTQDLDAILGYVNALRELDTTTTEPMTHAVPFDCPLRLDVVGESLPRGAPLSSGAEAVRARKTTARDVTEAYLERVARLDAALGAYLLVAGDAARN